MPLYPLLCVSWGCLANYSTVLNFISCFVFSWILKEGLPTADVKENNMLTLVGRPSAALVI